MLKKSNYHIYRAHSAFNKSKAFNIQHPQINYIGGGIVTFFVGKMDCNTLNCNPELAWPRPIVTRETKVIYFPESLEITCFEKIFKMWVIVKVKLTIRL